MTGEEVIVVGSGANGLAAAITMARAGYKVQVFEAATTIGGSLRSQELTLPGFVHDLCSAVHPLAVASPFFRQLPLEDFGLEWVHSPAAAAHPLDKGQAVLLETGVEATARNLEEDERAYLRQTEDLASKGADLFSEVLQPILHWPRHPLLLARFGLPSVLSANTFAHRMYRGTRARALFAGIAAHANAPLDTMGTAAIGWMLNLAAHVGGWPFPRGGAQKLAQALAEYLKSLGGEIHLGKEIRSLKDLPPAHFVFWDLTPVQIFRILGAELSFFERRSFQNFKYGPGVFKMDWALSEPIPWTARECRRAATVHLGGTLEEIREAESMPSQGKFSEKPYVLLTQPSLFDHTRAPVGRHTAWAYCHVPHNSEVSQVEFIEKQIERFAPGFRDVVMARSALTAMDMQKKNANLVGGDISGGALNLRQLLFRPTLKMNPYRLSIKGHFICSSSTPPGPGVHGMGGYNAARQALAM